jgi:hypothetical protein
MPQVSERPAPSALAPCLSARTQEATLQDEACGEVQGMGRTRLSGPKNQGFFQLCFIYPHTLSVLCMGQALSTV